MDTCLIFKNLFNYDHINPIPHNIPDGVDPIYITDSSQNAHIATSFGWKVYVTDMFKEIGDDSFERRKAIAFINCYPERIIPELLQYTYIFICDSNVRSFDPDYKTFVAHKSPLKALYLTTGWYSGSDNTIYKEMQRSMMNQRWKYNFKEIKESTLKYIHQLNDKGIADSDMPVASAKYIGWNIGHPNKHTIADNVYEEYLIHLQGNIIFSYILHMYPDDITHYINSFKHGSVGNHLSTY